jgi:tetratricopeptide (TPR) repeat protein
LTDPSPCSRREALAKLHRYDEAVAYFDRALEIDPLNADAWVSRGEALRRLSRYAEAIEDIDRAIEIDARHARAWNSKGLALMALGRDAEADAAFAKGEEILLECGREEAQEI